MNEYTKIIDRLDLIFSNYKDYLFSEVKNDNGIIYSKTSFVFSVLQRSLAMIDAYRALLETNNIMVLNSLSRMQIDNCIFVYGIYMLVDNKEDINELYKNFISNEKKLSNYKIGNKKLHDSYIVSKLNEKYDDFEEMYKFYCRFVHCSDSAFLYSTHIVDEEKKVVEFALTIDYKRYYKQCLINADTFCEICDLLLILIKKYWEPLENGNRLN